MIKERKMIKNTPLLFFGSLLVSSALIPAGLAKAADDYPVMQPDKWVEFIKQQELAPRAPLYQAVEFRLMQAEGIGYGTSMDLLDKIDYDPNARNQGSCGNCWVWASTGVMEIAHQVQNNVFDRHSIQYLNSCQTSGYACCGGGIGGFATWYSGEGQALPWSNTNASYADGARRCSDGASLVSCGDIGTTPNFPITSITDLSIDTHSGAATAIANIKNILNQQKGIYFGFALPNADGWDDFRDFWRNNPEATLWNDINDYCGQEWNEDPGEAGGHAVLIVGYNDDDADANNHYWLALNSWGTAGGVRPNGLFRVPMNVIDYNCSYPDNGTPGYWAFSFATLDVEFGNAPPTSDPGGPYAEECMGVTTSINLDGSGSSDPEGGSLTYAWTSDCTGASFDDFTSATPVLTIASHPGCSVSCNVSLTVTDSGGVSSETEQASINVTDPTPPTISCPADITVECDQSTAPAHTGMASATDVCDPAPAVAYVDNVVPGACPAEKVITRTWTANDACSNAAACSQVITVVDTTAPVISCNAPATIYPPDAPISFTASAIDNCDSTPSVEVVDYRCFMTTKKGKAIDKEASCMVGFSGNTVTINDSGGVGDNIYWTVQATDCSGNVSTKECSVMVVNPAQ